jgi:N-formylglutamate deformylase
VRYQLTTLPILISIPHGGTEIPEEIRGLTSISTEAIMEDVDVFTQDIYFVEDVRAVITSPIARTFVDLNRAPSDLPPQSQDGAVKTRTARLEPIYRDGNLADEIIGLLIRKYHEPYHRRIEETLKNDNIKLALDCHSMSTIAPPISRYHGRARPTICLGNVRGNAAPTRMVYSLAECFREVFELPQNEVLINSPFAGGYITRRYGNNPVPWIQVEMNRKLYCALPWFNDKTRTVERKRLELLNCLFKETISLFVDCLFN